jgi:hypothetical protein
MRLFLACVSNGTRGGATIGLGITATSHAPHSCLIHRAVSNVCTTTQAASGYKSRRSSPYKGDMAGVRAGGYVLSATTTGSREPRPARSAATFTSVRNEITTSGRRRLYCLRRAHRRQMRLRRPRTRSAKKSNCTRESSSYCTDPRPEKVGMSVTSSPLAAQALHSSAATRSAPPPPIELTRKRIFIAC